MIVPVILAAGESRRMGQPKALLPIYQTTFIQHIVEVLRSLVFPTIIVVLGHEAEQIRERMGPIDAEVIINSQYREGQLTSLQAAIRHILSVAYEASGILVCLVDHPLLNSEVIGRMIQAFAVSNKPIIIPTYRGQRGHPVIFARALFSELMQAPFDQGAKAVVRQSPERVLELETEDDAILIDIDTPEKYEALCRRLNAQRNDVSKR